MSNMNYYDDMSSYMHDPCNPKWISEMETAAINCTNDNWQSRNFSIDRKTRQIINKYIGSRYDLETTGLVEAYSLLKE